MDPHKPDVFYATTIVSVRRNGRVVVAGDGQVTLGHTVMKSNARKVRRLGRDSQVLAGFAGAAADATCRPRSGRPPNAPRPPGATGAASAP